MVCLHQKRVTLSDAGILISMGEKDTSPYFSAIAEKYGECEEEKENKRKIVKKIGLYKDKIYKYKNKIYKKKL